MDAQARWEAVYRTRQPYDVSWFQREATRSLDLMRRVAPDPGAAIIDVGGGVSVVALGSQGRHG